MDNEKYAEAMKRALVMADMAIETRREGDYDDFLLRGFDRQLQQAIRNLLGPGDGVVRYGAVTIDHLWSEVPHLHVKLLGSGGGPTDAP